MNAIVSIPTFPDEFPCAMNKYRGFYGGEDYMYKADATDETDCQLACHIDTRCVKASYVVNLIASRCILYQDGQFKETEELNAITWDKVCPGTGIIM